MFAARAVERDDGSVEGAVVRSPKEVTRSRGWAGHSNHCVRVRDDDHDILLGHHGHHGHDDNCIA